jgi:hypothetical protein
VPSEAIIDQVRGILDRYEVRYQVADSGRQYLARFGSAGVFIDFGDHDEKTAVVIHAPAVQELELDEDARGRLLERLNEINDGSPYVKAYLHEAVVHLEYVLLGEDLQGRELMNAAYLIASAADGLDDELARDFGGKTFAAMWDEAETEQPVDT